MGRHLDDHVGPARPRQRGARGLEADRVDVRDARVGAGVEHRATAFGRARGAEHGARAQHPRELHRREPDAARSAVHEHRLAAREAAQTRQRPQRGEESDRHRGRLLEAHVVGNLRRERGVDRRARRVQARGRREPAVRAHARHHDAVSLGEPRRGRFRHRAGRLEAWHPRERRQVVVNASSNVRVGGIDARGGHRDRDLTGRRMRRGAGRRMRRLEPQHARRSVLPDNDGGSAACDLCCQMAPTPMPRLCGDTNSTRGRRRRHPARQFRWRILESKLLEHCSGSRRGRPVIRAATCAFLALAPPLD